MKAKDPVETFVADCLRLIRKRKAERVLEAKERALRLAMKEMF